MLNLTEHEIATALKKNQNTEQYCFFPCLMHSDGVFILPIMLLAVKINLMLNWVEQKNSFITSGPGFYSDRYILYFSYILSN